MKMKTNVMGAMGLLGGLFALIPACESSDSVVNQLAPEPFAEPEPAPEPAVGGCATGCSEQWVCNQWQKAGGYPVDVVPDHYLFVHGLHGDSGAFSEWSNYSGMLAVRALGYKVESAQLGDRPPYGKGTGTLGEWVYDLANHINSMSLPDRSLVVIAHSFGSIAAECLLEVGGGGNCSGRAGASYYPGPNYAAAALKIKQLHTVQAAHGGCGDDNPDGHGAFGGYSCSTKDAIRAITTDSLNINMALATAGGAVHVNHVRASGPGDCLFCDECEGKGVLFVTAGDFCSDNDSHDGQTQDDAHQDSGRFPGGYGAANQAAGITRSSRHSNYCHGKGDDHPSYREGASRVRDLVGQTPPCTGGYKYCLCGGGE